MLIVKLQFARWHVKCKIQILEDHFEGFPREDGKPEVVYVGTNEYYEGMNAEIAYERPDVKNTFGEVCARNGIRQFRVTETEKWAHLTFFFNGIKDVVHTKEERTLIPSDKIATYDKAPDMQAQKITDQVIDVLDEDNADVVLINYANPDMLGHTGVKQAIIDGVEVVDRELGRVVDKTLEKDGALLIIADHGNAELNFDESCQQKHTAHTMNRVPCILVSQDKKLSKVELEGNAALKDVAPTLLDILGIAKPKEMTGNSIIKK
jgi:2,3-bisphosphoglycerate-independent phosphoglycerate mutase